MIRATPVSELNDPFEGKFNEKQIKDLFYRGGEAYKSKGGTVEELDDYELNEVMGVLHQDFSDLGVISFTEDYNNPLMWAHYADENRGIVVEFDFSEPFFEYSLKKIGNKRSRFGPSYLGDIFEFPEKVSYRRDMPSFSRLEKVDNEREWRDFLNLLNKSILYTKSDDWIYEKEQRSIVRLEDADSIICRDDDCLRDVCSRDQEIRVIELKDKDKIQIVFPPEYEMHEDMGDNSIKSEIDIILSSSFGLDPVHLFRINPHAISGVYFGCKAETAIIDILREQIKNNGAFNHLKHIYRMEVNDQTFSFDPVSIE